MIEYIEIWKPRYHDDVCLIAKRKVREGWNYIKFTKDPNLKMTYKIKGSVIKTFPLESNGKIPCYAVAMDALEVAE